MSLSNRKGSVFFFDLDVHKCNVKTDIERVYPFYFQTLNRYCTDPFFYVFFCRVGLANNLQNSVKTRMPRNERTKGENRHPSQPSKDQNRKAMNVQKNIILTLLLKLRVGAAIFAPHRC